ncbi:MAG: ORF6N domain-containing protein, partial [Bacteroidia bacterium]|nr:ORF6N domain-containing protein [Bacteroidia bacterium]
MEIIQSLQNRIYEIRGQRVILDKDLALIYDTDTRVLNQAVKRHIDRFPLDFMFQLTSEELEQIKFNANINDLTPNLRSQ